MHGRRLHRLRPTADRPRSAASHAKAPTPHTQAMAKRAYAAHIRHSRSVPGSDVRVERRSPPKRLRTEPRALKEPSPHEPRRSVQYTQDQLGERVRSDVLALNDRDARQPQNGEIFSAVTYYRVCGVSVLPEKSQARKQAPHPKPSHGSGRPMQQQHSVWAGMAAKHESECGKRTRRGQTAPY